VKNVSKKCTCNDLIVDYDNTMIFRREILARFLFSRARYYIIHQSKSVLKIQIQTSPTHRGEKLRKEVVDMNNMSLFVELRKFCRLTDIYPCDDGAELFLIRKGDSERYEALLAFLKELGFSEKRQHTIGDVRFNVLAQGNHVLSCSFTPCDGRMRVVSQEDGVIPPIEAQPVKAITTPLLTQVRTAYVFCDCGMSYLLRLSDGRFVMIDGNAGEYEEVDYLMDLVTKQNVLPGKPVFAAWIITHPHGDHFDGFSRFVKKYGDKIELGDVIYNFGRTDMSGRSSMAHFGGFLEDNKDRIRVINARSGQVFSYGDAEFETLTSAEDLYPPERKDTLNCNDTSLSFMLTFAGRRILILGDLQGKGAEYASKRYPAETFKCEFLQVGHHGYWGGSEEMYRAADPDFLLWPCPDFWFARVRGWKPNQVLFEECKNIKGIFVGGQREDVIDMSKPTEYVSHYVDVADGETVYEETCERARVIDYGWNCVCGGSTGYNGAIFTLGEDAVTMDSIIRPNPVVCMFVQRGQMDLLDDFTLIMKGKVDPQSECFGLYWNYPDHDKFSADDVLPVFHDADGSFDFKLTADSAAGLAKIYHNGALVATVPYKKRPDSGLYYVMKKALVTMRYVKLVKGVH